MSVLREALKIETWIHAVHAGPYGMPFSLQSPSQPCFGCHATLPRLPERLFSLRITQVPLYSETPQTKKFVIFFYGK